MKKIGIFYVSYSGITECNAFLIAKALKLSKNHVFDIVKTKISKINAYDVMILGSPTYGNGETPDDFLKFLKDIKDIDLSEKTVALFGCGNKSTYNSTFCNAIGLIYKNLKKTGCRIIGETSTKGLPQKSKAIVNGHYVGLPLDDNSRMKELVQRTEAWALELKQNF